MTPIHDLLPGFRGLILFCIFDFGARIVSGAPATSGVVGIQIEDGQIQVPASPQSATSLYKAIDVAGHEIVYIGSVGLNSLGSSTT